MYNHSYQSNQARQALYLVVEAKISDIEWPSDIQKNAMLDTLLASINKDMSQEKDKHMFSLFVEVVKPLQKIVQFIGDIGKGSEADQKSNTRMNERVAHSNRWIKHYDDKMDDNTQKYLDFIEKITPTYHLTKHEIKAFAASLAPAPTAMEPIIYGARRNVAAFIAGVMEKDLDDGHHLNKGQINQIKAIKKLNASPHQRPRTLTRQHGLMLPLGESFFEQDDVETLKANSFTNTVSTSEITTSSSTSQYLISQNQNSFDISEPIPENNTSSIQGLDVGLDIFDAREQEEQTRRDTPKTSFKTLEKYMAVVEENNNANQEDNPSPQ